MKLIWVTRGRRWGTTFLRDGGFADPLPEFERAFADAGSSDELWLQGDRSALRFPDPEGRVDAAGRRILHEFVLLEHIAGADSFDTARQRVWAETADEYATVWGAESPR